MDAREYALKHALEPLRAQYDYIFIDCPPSLELLTLNALCAADQVLIDPAAFHFPYLLRFFCLHFAAL